MQFIDRIKSQVRPQDDELPEVRMKQTNSEKTTETSKKAQFWAFFYFLIKNTSNPEKPQILPFFCVLRPF
ncbi:hypothetical protein C5O22_13720 [Treponema sp. J25]|nr:hypothetical protein C5O22_13720 [Treponema sp. J25]